MLEKIKKYFVQIVIFITSLLVFVFTGVFVSLPLNNAYFEDIIRESTSLFAPTDYVFVLGKFIICLSILFSVWSLFKRDIYKTFFNDIIFTYVLSGAFYIIWLIAFHFREIEFATVLIFSLLACLVQLYKKVFENKVSGIGRITFSVYTGWVSVLTVLNISMLLSRLNWDGLSLPGDTWSALLIFLLTLLSFYLLNKFNDRIFYITITWAVIGIWLNNPDSIYIFVAIFINVLGYLIREFLLYINSEKENNL